MNHLVMWHPWQRYCGTCLSRQLVNALPLPPRLGDLTQIWWPSRHVFDFTCSRLEQCLTLAVLCATG
jgi:hypothetical protein